MELDDSRFNNSGIPRILKLTTEEIIAKKDAEIHYLKAELKLIKKLELEEIQVINNKLPSYRIFDLITFIINKFNLKCMVKHLYTIAGVSKSGYYSHRSKIDRKNVRE